MTTQFETLKNGKNAQAVWANPTTKEITSADRNSFGYNKLAGMDKEFDAKYGVNMKTNISKSKPYHFSYSAKQMQEIGFILVKRGENTLW
jgi:hypothetical protein